MINIEEGTTCFINSDEIYNLRRNGNAKIFVNGEYFYIEEIEE